MNDPANLPDAFLKHTMRGGIGDHQSRQAVPVFIGLRRKIGNVNVAMLVAGDRHHLEPCDDCAGGVGPMR